MAESAAATSQLELLETLVLFNKHVKAVCLEQAVKTNAHESQSGPCCESQAGRQN